MSGTKRRQVLKDPYQQQIPFPQSKLYQDTYLLNQEYMPSFEQKMNQYQNGAKQNSTPYRSMNRINKLISGSPGSFKQSTSKISTCSNTTNFLKQVGSINSLESKPSSVTTACTYAPNEMSAIKSECGKARKKREVKSERKQPPQNMLLGQKRQPQMRLDHMEYFLRLNSKNAKLIAQRLRLRDKKTGQVYELPLFEEKDIFGLRGNSVLKSIDMSKMEVEYDYDTDCEQLKHSKKMLLHELLQAIEFFIKDDPLKLVDNVFL